MINFFNFIKCKMNTIFRINSETERKPYRKYESFLPSDDIDNGEEYIAALDWAINKSNAHNIAVSGPYSAGKSSVIKSYLKRVNDNNFVRISLATFAVEECDNNLNGCTPQQIEERLEAAILKQLFYSVSSNKISQSRFRKLQVKSGIGTCAMSLVVTVMMCTALYFIFPDKVKEFVDKIESLKNFKYLIYAAVTASYTYAIVNLVGWIRRNGGIKEINILETASIHGDEVSEETIFNKYMDEIVYFFEATKKTLVIIEDLDRFNNPSIFIALRELNTVLNNYETIKKDIKFIYAIKDDMFKKEGERTKFFDFIIPIVPYISSTNSGDILLEKLDVDSETGKSRIYDISENYVSLVSPYIRDIRDLTSICNEFNVFKNTLKGNQQLDLIDKKMFSMIIFKNLYPKDFADLESESSESSIRLAFECKRKFISERNLQSEEKKSAEKDVLEKIENEGLKSVKELKLSLLNSFTNFELAVYMIRSERNAYYLKDVLQDDFEIELLKKEGLRVYWINNGNNSWTNIDNPIDYDKGHGDYFTRIERIKKGLAKCKEESRARIEKFERIMNELKSYSIKRVIEEFGIEFLDEKVRSNDLLVFLLRHEYIDESYENYINYFHPNSLTKEDMNFILGVRNHRSVGDYTYKINSPGRVCSRLQDYEFKQAEVLNYDIVDYILQSGKTHQISGLFEKLKDQSSESMDFIKAFVDRNNNLDRFFENICRDNVSFWYLVVHDSGITKEKRYKYLENMLKFADIDDIRKMNYEQREEGEPIDEDESISGLLKSDVDALKKISEAPFDKTIALIENLVIIFTDVDVNNINPEIQRKIFDEYYYELNINMIRRIFEWKQSELINNLMTQNYTSILKLDYEPIKEYVQDDDCFEEYVRNVVLAIESNTCESIESIEDIIERLYDKQIDLCKQLIDKEDAIWSDITICLSKEDATNEKEILWKKLLDSDKVSPSWENYITFYDMFGLKKELGDFFERHIEDFLSDSDNEVITREIVIESLFMDLSEENYRKYIRTFSIKDCDESVLDFGVMKINVLIEEGALAFTLEIWNQIGAKYPELRVKYAKVNREAFINLLEEIDITESEISAIILDNEFSELDKQAVLRKLDIENISMDMALIMRNMKFKLNRDLADATWELLETDKKYALLLNQISLYKDDELADMFMELDEPYHTLADRSRHKFKLADTEYNNNLLNELNKREYITSFTKDKDNREDVLVGYVKQRKSTTVVAN